LQAVDKVLDSLTLHWLLTGAAVILAVAAFVKARHTARRLDRLTESYWELRYEHGQLRARINRLDPDARTEGPAAAPAPPKDSQTFIPLSSLKR
jgi:hypothetical protein